MKYFLFFVMSLLVLIAGCLTSPLWSNGGSEDEEILEGTGMGYRGPIHVRLRMNSGSITEIDVDSIEDRFVGGAAIEELIDLIIEYNSVHVGAVSGATETSRGFLSAVENAIISGRK
jgi:urocanate reductase